MLPSSRGTSQHPCIVYVGTHATHARKERARRALLLIILVRCCWCWEKKEDHSSPIKGLKLIGQLQLVIFYWSWSHSLHSRKQQSINYICSGEEIVPAQSRHQTRQRSPVFRFMSLVLRGKHITTIPPKRRSLSAETIVLIPPKKKKPARQNNLPP